MIRRHINKRALWLLRFCPHSLTHSLTHSSLSIAAHHVVYLFDTSFFLSFLARSYVRIVVALDGSIIPIRTCILSLPHTGVRMMFDASFQQCTYTYHCSYTSTDHEHIDHLHEKNCIIDYIILYPQNLMTYVFRGALLSHNVTRYSSCLLGGNSLLLTPLLHNKSKTHACG